MGLPTFLTIIGGYVVTSAILFRFPTLIHTKKTLKFLAKHISHRGGSAEGYENTITSYQKALEVGTDMIELDVHLTKDGKVVAVHDNNLLRLTGVDIFVSSTAYKDLPQLMSTVPVDFLPGFFYEDPNYETVDRRIPLLEDVFETFSDVPMNIDIKVNNDTLIKEVSRLIKTYKREHLSVWGNTWYQINEKCYFENPEIYRFCSRRRVLIILLSYYLGLLPFIPIKETHFEIFLPRIYENFSCYVKYSGLAKFLVRVMELILIRESLFTHLKKRGLQVYIWVLNEDKYFEYVFGKGIQGVMTDRPTKLKEYIDRNPQLFVS